MRNYLFILLTVASLLFACKSSIRPDGTMQITKDDVINLDGTFEDNFLQSWEYVMLDDNNPDAIMAGVDGILYDDDLFFIMCGRYSNNNSLGRSL